MSGNPFRISQYQPQKSVTAVPPTSFSFIDADSSRAEQPALEIDTVNLTPTPAKTKKTVRIESPAASPPHPAFYDADDTLSERLGREEQSGSPPTLPTASPDPYSSRVGQDSFQRPMNSGEDAYRSTPVTRSSRQDSEAWDGSQSSSGVPPNPFSRTLATIEPQAKDRVELEHTVGQGRDRPASDKQGPAAAKAMDVEDFKRLLMTGINPQSSAASSQASTATVTVPAPAPTVPSIFESGSSTDTSSVSRQSIFEPVQEPHVETPRTSYEMARSDDDEQISLMGETKKAEKKKAPPPAPKHRHGKLVSARTPQTVSFSDFSAPSFIPAIEATSPSSSRKRTDSDLNKPLPPPPTLAPAAHITSQLDDRPALDTKASESSSLSDTSLSQKKQPPPVPLARRQSQLRSSNTGNRSRSNSALTTSSQLSVESNLLSPGLVSEVTSNPQGHKSPPPPPPPSRRHGAALAGISSSSANSSSTELSTAGSGRRSDVAPPEPPSARRTTFSSPPSSPPAPAQAQSLNRATSVNSRSVSNESATMAPPPPPPPRRRQSGRTSLDERRPYNPSNTSPTESRRTSSENKRSSLDGKRRTSVASESSLRYEYAPTSEQEHPLYSPKEELTEEPRSLEPIASNNSNILDDMEKFQQEIDALRDKYRSTS